MDHAELPAEDASLKPISRLGMGRRIWEFPVTRILAYLLLTGVMAAALTLPVQWAVQTAHLHLRGQTEIVPLLNELLVVIAAVGAFYVMSRWGDPANARASGFERQGVVSETAAGLLIGAVIFSLVIGILAAFGTFHVPGINSHAQLLLPLALFLGVGILEETIFRGYIFQTLELRWGSAVALGVSALLFGLAHLGNPISGLTLGQRLAGPFFIVFEASILMSAAYLLTRRLWMPIGIHWGWNFFESSVYGTADSGQGADPRYTLLHSTLSGPFWLTGGRFGPEASVICLIVCTATGFLLLHQAIRRGQWRPRSYYNFSSHTQENKQLNKQQNEEATP